MKIDYVFPTPIGIDAIDLDVCNQSLDLVKKLILEEKTYADPSKRCNTTQDDLYKLNGFEPLVEIIDQHVKRYARDVLQIEEDSLELTGMWSNIHKSGSKHHNHMHPNSYISGVVYLQIPKCELEGSILFKDPRQAKLMSVANYTGNSCVSDISWWYRPVTGMILIFPSWLEHGTDQFISSSNDVRVSLSFNYRLTKCSVQTMQMN